MKLELLVIVEPELTAMRTRLGPCAGTLTIVRNQRPDRRSYRTWGSLTSTPPRTELKNVSRSALRPPRLPALSNTLIRPLMYTRTWVGPTSPVLSGGMNPDSESWAPRKLVPTVWEV